MSETPEADERVVMAEDPTASERAEEPENAVPDERTPRSELTVLVHLRDQLQKLRIAEGNRVSSAVVLDEQERANLHRSYYDRLEQFEDDITKAVRLEMRTHPAWPWLQTIHGVAETSAAVVVGYIDIEACPTVSSLWRYAGFGVIVTPCVTCEGSGQFEGADCTACRGTGSVGKRERPTKGEKLHYNARLKTMVWRLIDLQVRSRGPYRTVYDAAKHTYVTTRPDWTLGHAEQAARRKAAKIFLSHLWVVWRTAEELEVRAPFIEGKGGHTTDDPWTFIETWNREHEAAKEAVAAGVTAGVGAE